MCFQFVFFLCASSGAAAGENALVQQQQLLQQHNPYYQHLSPPSHLPQHAYYNPRQPSSNGEYKRALFCVWGMGIDLYKLAWIFKG